MNLKDLTEPFAGLSEANRPIRLRLSQGKQVFDDVLLVKRVTGSETLCGGLEYRLLCISTCADLPLKEFIALPVELQFVTDRGDVRAVCGIVAQAAAGQGDGGLATYELLVRDALALMEHRTNTRVFRNRNEMDITQVILDEWRQNNPALAKAFDVDWSYITGTYPAREFTMQHNESDAGFAPVVETARHCVVHAARESQRVTKPAHAGPCPGAVRRRIQAAAKCRRHRTFSPGRRYGAT
jgi:type VI secretion system secreted protein VgrG